MSFISIGDIISISQLIGNLLSRVRTAAAEFRVFAGDLNLTQTILRQLQSNWGILALRLGESERNTIRSIFKGIRRGLNELENQLERYQNVGGIRHGIANLRFSNHLADLQRRLQFHMSALQLLAQNGKTNQLRKLDKCSSKHWKSSADPTNKSVDFNRETRMSRNSRRTCMHSRCITFIIHVKCEPAKPCLPPAAIPGVI
jgi:hypothetical protein